MSKIISQHWTEDREKLEAFVLDRIGKKESALLSSHLERCEECRKRVQEEREIIEGIRRFGRMEMKKKLGARLKRERGRQFEWLHVASLAAAILVIFGAVFVVRTFLDFRVEKTAPHEIILTDNNNEKPESRPLWIIGRVVDIRENEVSPSGSVKTEASKSFADELREMERPESLNKPGVPASSPDVGHITRDIKSAETGKAASGSIAYSASPSGSAEQMQRAREPAADAAAEKKGIGESAVNDKMRKKMETAVPAAEETPHPAVSTTVPGRMDTAVAVYKELYGKKTADNLLAATAPPREPVSAAAKIAADKYRTASGQQSGFIKRGKLIKNVIVRRGNMDELPASMRSSDPSVIHTKLERTKEGVLLTFYSPSIKDTTARYIEEVARDSIIVSFSNRQISYHIPGGLKGGM